MSRCLFICRGASFDMHIPTACLVFGVLKSGLSVDIPLNALFPWNTFRLAAWALTKVCEQSSISEGRVPSASCFARLSSIPFLAK